MCPVPHLLDPKLTYYFLGSIWGPQIRISGGFKLNTFKYVPFWWLKVTSLAGQGLE